MEQQIKLFNTILPKKFQNVRYRCENTIIIKPVSTKISKHIIEIFEISDITFYSKPLHKLYFIENPDKQKIFEFTPKLHKFVYTFELFNNEKDFIRSEIPILNSHDFLRICEIFNIGLTYEKSTIEQPKSKQVESNISITKQIIRIDNIPKIFLSHVNKSATIQNINNELLEKTLYNIITENLNSYGLKLNHLRNNLNDFRLIENDYQIVNNLILTIQNKLDIDSDQEIYKYIKQTPPQ